MKIREFAYPAPGLQPKGMSTFLLTLQHEEPKPARFSDGPASASGFYSVARERARAACSRPRRRLWIVASVGCLPHDCGPAVRWAGRDSCPKPPGMVQRAENGRMQGPKENRAGTDAVSRSDRRLRDCPAVRRRQQFAYRTPALPARTGGCPVGDRSRIQTPPDSIQRRRRPRFRQEKQPNPTRLKNKQRLR